MKGSSLHQIVTASATKCALLDGVYVFQTPSSPIALARIEHALRCRWISRYPWITEIGNDEQCLYLRVDGEAFQAFCLAGNWPYPFESVSYGICEEIDFMMEWCS